MINAFKWCFRVIKKEKWYYLTTISMMIFLNIGIISGMPLIFIIKNIALIFIIFMIPFSRKENKHI